MNASGGGGGGVAVGRALIEEDAVTSAALALYKSPRWWFLATPSAAGKSTTETGTLHSGSWYILLKQRGVLRRASLSRPLYTSELKKSAVKRRADPGCSSERICSVSPPVEQYHTPSSSLSLPTLPSSFSHDADLFTSAAGGLLFLFHVLFLPGFRFFRAPPRLF